MLTNPNTCGLFERDIVEIARLVHEAGALFYCDGANFNAIVGRVRPADLGIDAMHINLHKTFSTPHGGGGPGSGPVVLSEALAPFAPASFVVRGPNGFTVVEHPEGESFGRLKAFTAVGIVAPGLQHVRRGCVRPRADAVRGTPSAGRSSLPPDARQL